MVWLALLIASLALVIAVVAFLRTGGRADVRRRMVALNTRTEDAFRLVSARADQVVSAAGTRTGGVREKAADAVSRLEHTIRGKASDSNPSS